MRFLLACTVLAALLAVGTSCDAQWVGTMECKFIGNWAGIDEYSATTMVVASEGPNKDLPDFQSCTQEPAVCQAAQDLARTRGLFGVMNLTGTEYNSAGWYDLKMPQVTTPYGLQDIDGPVSCYQISDKYNDTLAARVVTIVGPLAVVNNDTNSCPHDDMSKAAGKIAFKGKLTGGDVFCFPPWIIGLCICICGSFCSTMGLNLQKVTQTKLMERKERGETGVPHYASQPLWMLGMSLLVLDAILDVFSFGMAPQSLIAPLAGLNLIWNVLIAPCLHKDEKWSLRGLLATSIIVAGLGLSTAFAQHATPLYSIEKIREQFAKPGMIIHQIVVISLCIGIASAISLTSPKSKARRNKQLKELKSRRIIKSRVSTPAAAAAAAKKEAAEGKNEGDEANATTDIVATAGIDVDVTLDDGEVTGEKDGRGSPASSVGSSHGMRPFNPDNSTAGGSNASSTGSGPMGDQMMRSPSGRRVKMARYTPGTWSFQAVRMGYCMCAGILGGQTVLLAKTVIELFKTALATCFVKNNFAYYDWWLALLGMIAALMFETHLLNMGLKHYDALYIMPVFIFFYTVFGILAGGVYMEEFNDWGGEDSKIENIICFPVGVLVCMLGIYIMTTTGGKHKELRDDLEEGKEMDAMNPGDVPDDASVSSKASISSSMRPRDDVDELQDRVRTATFGGAAEIFRRFTVVDSDDDDEYMPDPYNPEANPARN